MTIKRELMVWVVILFSSLPNFGWSQTYGSFNYTVSGAAVTITGYNGLGGVVMVPGAIPNVGTVVTIGASAFANNNTVTSLSLPDSVTSVGDCAFYQCTVLTNVILGNGLQYIGQQSFYKCGALFGVSFPGTLTFLDQQAFYGCSTLTNVTLPNSVTNLGDGLFFGCAALSRITIPNTITSIPGGAFSGCLQLGGVVLPNSITSIGNLAFNGCSNLASITIPDGVTSLGDAVFSGCIALNSITLSAAMTSIGQATFYNCYSLSNLAIPSGVSSVASSAFINCYGLTNISMPNSVTSIGDSAFDNCRGLTSITLPNALTSIGNWAFYNCIALTNLIIPGTVTSIGDSALCNCSALNSLVLPNGLSSISDYAFYQCTALTNITLPNSLASIGAYAFYKCNPTSLVIPNNVTNIGDGAFGFCGNLNSISFQGNAPASFGTGVFDNAASGFTVLYPPTASGFSSPSWNGYAAAAYGAVYFLPNTGDGLIPTQSWDAVGSTPSGDIYVSGMDHVSNAALYHFRPSTGTLEYVGDAHAASAAANNWLSGEAVQKFHTRPFWYKGKVYVATLNYSNLDPNYLLARGSKWYAYDEAVGTFTDLSAAEPGGTAISKGGFLGLVLSPFDQKFYAMTLPTADLISYDPASNVTTDLGRPSQFNKPYVYSTRFPWADSQGRVYLSAGNPAWSPQTGTPDDPNVFDHVYYYDPGQGFGQHTDWPLVNTTAIQSGQWSLDRRFAYMMDDQANIFVFDDQQRTFTWLAKVPVQAIGTWVFQLSANQKKIYIIEGQHDSACRLFEFDVNALQSRVLCSLSDLAPAVPRGDVCGYDSWDTDGRFYITSGSGQTNVAFFQLDPVLIKVAFGFLPSLTQVQIVASSSDPNSFSLVRTGDTTQPCSAVYSARVPYNPTIAKQFYTATIPAGQTSLDVAFPRLTSGSVPQMVTVDLIPDGDIYKTGASRSLTVSFDAIAQAGMPLPTVDLEQPTGTPVVNGATKDWGSVALGSFADLNFTLNNTGVADLTGLALWIDGADASAFSITVYPAATVSPSGGTTSFTMRFSPVGAGMKTAVLHLVSNDPLNTPLSINLTGTALAPSMVVQQPAGSGLTNGMGIADFGAVPIGSSNVLTFTLQNVGHADLNGLSVSVINPVQSAFSVTTPPAATVTSQSGSTTFTVQFAPASAGPQTATLQLNSNDPLQNPFYIQLNGTTPAPAMAVQQQSGTALPNDAVVSFGAVPLGNSASITFSITNGGNGNLTSVNLLIDGPDAAAFIVSAPLISVLIPPGGKATFGIQFTPPTAGSKNATLHIASNDPSNSPFNIFLNGVGTAVVINPGSDLIDGPLFPPGAAALFLCLTAAIGCYWISRQRSF